MTARTMERNPTDLEAHAASKVERAQREIAVAVSRHAHLAGLLEERMGRRELRRQLKEAGLDVARPDVLDPTDRHHGQMCANVALRHRGEQLLWSLLWLATRNERLMPSLIRLFMETDHE